jgi:hypothetical protein
MGRDAGTAARSRGQSSASAIEPDRPRTLGRGRPALVVVVAHKHDITFEEKRQASSRIASSLASPQASVYLVPEDGERQRAHLPVGTYDDIVVSMGRTTRPERYRVPTEKLGSEQPEVAAVEACWVVCEKEELCVRSAWQPCQAGMGRRTVSPSSASAASRRRNRVRCGAQVCPRCLARD